MEKKSRSLILHETKQLRQKYYYEKQWLLDYHRFHQLDDRILFMFFEQGEGIPDSVVKAWWNSYNNVKEKTLELTQLKAEVDKLPHIPNKQERKEIRKLKQKANVNKKS
jgi:hypothetical protein